MPEIKAEFKPRMPKDVFMIKHEVGSIVLMYPAPDFSNRIPVEREDVLPLALVLLKVVPKITGGDIENAETVRDAFILAGIKNVQNGLEMEAKK